MNFVVNVLHMLLMFSSSLSITLPHIRHSFHLNVSIKTITIVLDFRDYCMCYLTLYDVIAASKWTTPLEDVHVICVVFLAELVLLPFNLELTFTSFPF